MFIKSALGVVGNSDAAKHAGDAAAITITVGTIVNLLPALAAVFTIVWTGIRIYETKTVQRLLKKRRK